MSQQQPSQLETVAPESALESNKGERLYRLPNGMLIAYQSRAEVEFFYDDVFEKEVYLQHGITLKDGDCIFDVGANIGFFTMFVHHKCRPSAVYAFEPAPPLFQILSRNAAHYGQSARLFNYGLADETKTAIFTFYPQSSGMSSFYADKSEEKEVLRTIMENQFRKGRAEMAQVLKHADDLLEERFNSLTFECQLRPLSDVFSEHRIARVDLLKIDVQKSELDVLAGIRDEDWHKLQQIVIEVHDIAARVEHVTAVLERHGFQVIVDQDELYEGSPLYNLYARRPAERSSSGEGATKEKLSARSIGQIRERARRQEDALQHQRRLMSTRRKD